MTRQHCCCCFSVKTGVKVLAVILGIGSVIGTAGALFRGVQTEDSDGGVVFATTLPGIFGLALNVMLFYGAHSEKRGFLLPWMIFKMIGIVISYIGCLVLFGCGIAVLVMGQDVKGQIFITHEGDVIDGDKAKLFGDIGGGLLIGIGGIWLIFTILLTYFWTVVKDHYISMGKGPDHVILVEDPLPKYKF